MYVYQSLLELALPVHIIKRSVHCTRLFSRALSFGQMSFVHATCAFVRDIKLFFSLFFLLTLSADRRRRRRRLS